MRKTQLILALALVLTATVPASAGGLYADLFLGPNQTDESKFSVLGTSSINTEFETGINYGFSFGYDFDSDWRVELEVMRREADVDTHELDMGGTIDGSDGEIASTSLFANVYYDFSNKSRVTPYVGLGFGSVMVDYKNFGVPGLDALDDDDDVFGYVMTAGLTVKINDRWDFRTDFRVLDADDPDVTSSEDTMSTMGSAEYMTLDMTAGVRFRF